MVYFRKFKAAASGCAGYFVAAGDLLEKVSDFVSGEMISWAVDLKDAVGLGMWL